MNTKVLLVLWVLAESNQLSSIYIIPSEGKINSETNYMFQIYYSMSTPITSGSTIKITFPEKVGIVETLNSTPTTCLIDGSSHGNCSVTQTDAIELITQQDYSVFLSIELGNIKNPDAVYLKSNMDKFDIKVSKDGATYLEGQEYLDVSSLEEGKLSSVASDQSNQKVGTPADYQIEFETQNSIPANGLVILEFSDDFELGELNTATGKRGSSEEVALTITKEGQKTYLQGLFTEKTEPTPVTLKLSKVTNPGFYGSASVEVTTGTNNREPIDSGTVSFSSNKACSITLSSKTFETDYVYSKGYIEFLINVDFYKNEEGYMIFEFPEEYPLTDEVECKVFYGFLRSNSMECTREGNKLTTSKDIPAFNSIKVKFSNVRNPQDNAETGYFNVSTVTGSGSLICQNTEFLKVNPVPNSITVNQKQRNSSKVSDPGPYILNFNTTTQFPETSYIKVVLPKEQIEKSTGIGCYEAEKDLNCEVQEEDNAYNLVIRNWCPSSGCEDCCFSNTEFGLTIQGVSNPKYVKPSITSSVQIYTMTSTGIIDQVTSGVFFEPDLEPIEITDGKVSRNVNTVGLPVTYTFSFTSSSVFLAGAKLVYELPEGSMFAEGTIECGEFSCNYGNYSSGSVKKITVEGVCTSECEKNTKFTVTVTAIENPISVKPIEGDFVINAYTSSGWIIERGTATSTLASLETNEISNFQLVRETDSIRANIYLNVIFNYKTEIPTSGSIEVELPENVAIISGTFKAFKSESELASEIEVYSGSNSLKKLVVTDYCPTECPKESQAEIKLTGLKTPDSIIEISGPMSIKTKDPNYGIDEGSLEDVKSILNELKPGDLYNADILPENPIVSESTNYRVLFTCEHNLPENAVIKIGFPEEVSINSSISCTSYFTISEDLECVFSDSEVKVTQGFPSGTTDPNIIGLYINNVVNPSKAQVLDTFYIKVTTQSDELVNQDLNLKVEYLLGESSCDENCDSCAENGNCYKCKQPSDKPLIKDYSCVSECPSGYFLNEYSCIKCHYTCSECLGEEASDCTSCADGYKRSDGYCVNNCPEGTINEEGTCVNKGSCNSPCSKCSSDPNFCLECETKILYIEEGQCLDTCPKGYYSNETQCFECNSNCADCKEKPDKCTECNPIYTKSILNKVSDTCVEECPELISVEKEQSGVKTCEPCDESCATCSGTEPDDCISCPKEGTKYLTTDNKCLAECTEEYGYNFENKTSEIFQCVAECPETYYVSNNTCEPCIQYCLSCENGSECLDCQKDKFTTEEKVCVDSCEADTYEYTLNDTKQCFKSSCPDGSARFKNSDGKLLCIEPESCPSEGYFKNSTDCSPCDPSCLTCSGPSTCLSCDNSSNLKYLEAGKCKDSCSETKYAYFDSEKYQCLESCPNSTFVLGRECYSECPEGYYSSESACETCNEACKTCTGPTSKDCSTCNSNYYLYEGECLAECPENYRKVEGKCVLICSQSSCLRCTEKDLDVCYECQEDYALYNQTCYYVCPSGLYKESSSCLSCNETCSTCNGPYSNNCTSCPDSTYFYESTCLESCPDGLVPKNGVCREPCKSPCEDCRTSDLEYCISCSSGYSYLFEGSCYQVCPEGFFGLNSTCSECHPSCGTCSGPETYNCLTCNSTLVLSPNLTCEESCPSGYNSTEGVCILVEIPVAEQAVSEDSESFYDLSPSSLYILVGEVVFGLLLVLLSKFFYKATHLSKPNIYVVLSIAQFTERLMLIVYLWPNSGYYYDLIMGFAFASVIASGCNSVLVLESHFDDILENSEGLQNFKAQNKASYYLVRALSLVFGPHLLRLFYSGFMSFRVSTEIKVIQEVEAFRYPLEALVAFSVYVMNVPEAIIRISMLAVFSPSTVLFKVGLIGLVMDLYYIPCFLWDYCKGPWN